MWNCSGCEAKCYFFSLWTGIAVAWSNRKRNDGVTEWCVLWSHWHNLCTLVAGFPSHSPRRSDFPFIHLTHGLCVMCVRCMCCVSLVIRDSRIYHVACIDGDAPVENSIRLFRLRWFHRIDIWLVSRFFFFCTKKAQSMNMCVSIEQSFPSFFHSVWLFSGSSRSVVCDKMLPTY